MTRTDRRELVVLIQDYSRAAGKHALASAMESAAGLVDPVKRDELQAEMVRATRDLRECLDRLTVA